MGVMLYPPHRVLGEAVLPFPPALAEVTLGIGCGRRVILRSYQEEEEAGERARHGLRQGVRAGLGGGRARKPRSLLFLPPQRAPSKPW